MLTDIIQFLFILLSTLYITFRLLNFNKISIKTNIFLAIASLLLSFAKYIIEENLTTHAISPLLIGIWLGMSLITTQPQNTFVSVTFSYLLSYILFGFCAFIIVLLCTPLRHTNLYISNLTITFLSGILELIIMLHLSRFKRFKRGTPFLFQTPTVNYITLLCIVILPLLQPLPYSDNRKLKYIILLTFILSLAILIHWWQEQITKSYKRSLQLRELESLRMELEDKEKRITELSKQNEELGRLIHKDNKLIPAMEHAVHEYFITDFDTLDAAKEKAQTLLLEIEELSKNRHNIILEINNAHSKHYATGIPALDTLLNYMDKRALQEHIALSVHLGVDLSNYIPTTITSEDLTHLLSDLLENAIIACKGASNANIQLQFYKSEKAFVIEIADNGIPFEIDSLVNFGITKLTTHADSGGSGIGLMDIWKIKEKYFASIHITELEANTPFSKKIAIIFNKKHRYSISSKRKEQLMQASKRADLHIFD